MTVPDRQRRNLLRLLLGLGGVTVGTGAFQWFSQRQPASPVEAALDPLAAPTAVAAETTTTTSPLTTTTEPASTTSAPPTTTTTPSFVITVICREAWRAEPAREGMEPHEVTRLTVHHTAAPIDSAARAPNQILRHQRFHRDDKGWPDIAYHFLIDPAGNVYEGRDAAFRGDTATEYDPAGHFLVCLEGEFDTAIPNESQISVLTDMLAYGAHTYGVDPATLGGHRDFASTSCPGENVYTLLEDGTLLERIRLRLAEGVPVLERVCGTDGDELVATIESGEA